MKIKRWMLIIVGLSLLLWLLPPAFRIGRDPGLRTHYHTIGSAPGWLTSLEPEKTDPKSSEIQAADLIGLDHTASFWDYYLAMIFGLPWPENDLCPEWSKLRARIRLNSMKDPSFPDNSESARKNKPASRYESQGEIRMIKIQQP
jgi:hypothetical protein